MRHCATKAAPGIAASPIPQSGRTLLGSFRCGSLRDRGIGGTGVVSAGLAADSFNR